MHMQHERTGECVVPSSSLTGGMAKVRCDTRTVSRSLRRDALAEEEGTIG